MEITEKEARLILATLRVAKDSLNIISPALHGLLEETSTGSAAQVMDTLAHSRLVIESLQVRLFDFIAKK